MKKISIILLTSILLLTFVILQSCTQTKTNYLEKNRFNLTSSDFDFPQKDFKIIGFGAYHGSSKTEDVELKLLESLIKNKSIKYYLPETDFSIAHYFNEYLKNGDTILLKDLVTLYGIRAPQERTIEVYKKWQELKKINDKLPIKDKLNIVGIDIQVNYKYVSKHILELINESENERKSIQEIREMVKIDTTSYEFGDLSYAHKILRSFVTDYDNNKSEYQKYINGKPEFEHIIKNLKISFNFSNEYRDRDKIMYNNYLSLDSIYNFKKHPQYLRMGFSHIEKSREGQSGYPYFFTRLIENNVYDKDNILSVIGYFTDSKVVWNELYDKEENYTGYTVEAGFGIGDYEKEFFRGIQNLKDSKISDKTLFRLNKKDSPYAENEPDLIEVIMQDEKSNGKAVKGMSTLDFLDYAILISDSKESIPIYEMK
jgi:hypothetical protein